MVLERWCASDEPGEFWSVECESVEEGDMKVGELRRIDPGYEIFQVFGGHFEQEKCQSGEDRSCPGKMVTPVPIWTRLWGFELQPKGFESGQRGETSDDRNGWKVPGMRNVRRVEADEVSGGQK
jgi:hypothetical protein